LGWKVALPAELKLVRRHGPSTPPCQRFPVKVDVVDPSFVRYVTTALHAASVLAAP